MRLNNAGAQRELQRNKSEPSLTVGLMPNLPTAIKMDLHFL